MEWRAYLAKPERIKKTALYRINGSAPRHFLKISLAESWANFFRKSLARGMSVVQACETTTKW